MKSKLLATIGLAAFAASGALAENNHHHRYDVQPVRDGYSRDGRYGQSNPVNRAMRDLQMIYSRARVDHHERDHFRRAISALDEFDARAARGQFDHRLLDRAMDNMADLAQADQLHPRDRAIVRDDLHALRSFRNYAGRRDYRW